MSIDLSFIYLKIIMVPSFPNWGKDSYFLTIKECAKLTSLSPSTIRRREQIGEFPRRQQISARRVGYRIDLVTQYCQERSTVNGGEK